MSNPQPPSADPSRLAEFGEILLRIERESKQANDATRTDQQAIRADQHAIRVDVMALKERVLGGAPDGARSLITRVEDLERRAEALEKALRFVLTSAVGTLITSGVTALVAWLLMR